jgi:hypothetical protein
MFTGFFFFRAFVVCILPSMKVSALVSSVIAHIAFIYSKSGGICIK